MRFTIYVIDAILTFLLQSDNQMPKQIRKKIPQSKKNHLPSSQGELRIIGGKWRSRKLTFPAVEGLRPSPSRVRETLFNWLTPFLTSSHCLDLFAGCGALGFEALSRGADSVTMVEQNRQVVNQLEENKRLLQADAITILTQDATDTNKLNGSFDIIFCDPPFNKGLIEPLLSRLNLSDILNPSTLIYVESEKKLKTIQLPSGWNLLKEKSMGDVRCRLIKVS
jgi:16S rRNA (guanine966-N2)-methyltransferase